MKKGFEKWAAVVAFCCLIIACQKELPEEEVIKLVPPDGKEYGWSLTLSDTVFGGCIDTAYYTTAGSAKTLVIQSSDIEGNVLSINLSSSTGNIGAGTYSSSNGNGSLILRRGNLYTVGNPTSPFTFHITNINDTIVEGEFEASFYDSTIGRRLLIYDGKMVAKINKKSACKPFVRPALPSATPAEFTLEKGTDGSCSSATVEGSYSTSLSLNNSHVVKLKVNVAKAGPYSISTSTVNGIKFSASGTFTATGVQTINLVGSGTPAAGGNIGFPITAGASTCNFSVNVQTGTAVYTLVGSPTTCSQANVQGLYAKGFQLTAGNKVELQVDVTTIGTYAIVSGPVNGISFQGSGSFTNYGLQKIILQGSGVPTTEGDNTMPVSGSGTNCSFLVNVKNDTTSTGTCTVANNTASLSGSGSMSFYTTSGGPNGSVYQLTGNGQGGDLRLEFFGTAKPTAGTYNIKPLSGNFVSKDVRVNITASGIYWSASEGKVTVAVANDKITASFCNIEFSGTISGPILKAKGEAKLTEQ